jgi:inosose dehydratase
MSSELSRRRFLSRLGLAAMAVPILSCTGGGGTGTADATSTETTETASASSPIKWGYAAITWGGNDREAIQEVASLGFKGIQLRSNLYQEYKDKPQELKQLLARHNLQVPVFSSGNVSIKPEEEQETIEKHVAHARFLKEVGGQYLQVTNNARPKDRPPTEEELQRLGRIMTEIGRRTAEFGVETIYHNHMNQLGETPEEVDTIMAATDPQYVSLLLDVAHYHQGGGDPAQAIRKYGKSIKALHIKDVESPVPGQEPGSYRFVELGKGNVDLPAVFEALRDINYAGWAIVELDAVPDKARTPLESAQISKSYLQDKLKMPI